MKPKQCSALVHQTKTMYWWCSTTQQYNSSQCQEAKKTDERGVKRSMVLPVHAERGWTVLCCAVLCRTVPKKILATREQKGVVRYTFCVL
jgi:hypothetical protein